MLIRKKLFHLTESEVNQVLFCDNSDDEEGLTLDDEDLGFLEKDLEFIEKNGEMDYVVEVNIEPPQSGTSKAIDDTLQQLEKNCMPSNSLEQLQFKFKKPSPENQKRVYEEADKIGIEFPYGKVCIEKELSGDLSPYAVFEKVYKFYHRHSDSSNCFVQPTKGPCFHY